MKQISWATVIGLVLLIAGLAAFFMDAHSSDAMHVKVIVGMIAAGLLLVVPKELAGGVRDVGAAAATAAEPFRKWRRSSGVVTPPEEPKP